VKKPQGRTGLRNWLALVPAIGVALLPRFT
jgi:hypothetical protein